MQANFASGTLSTLFDLPTLAQNLVAVLSSYFANLSI
jgi:hypothetical protein